MASRTGKLPPGIRELKNGRFQVRFRDPQGSSRGPTFNRLTDAKAFQNGVKTDMRRGTFVDFRLASARFEDVATDYLEATTHEPGTRLNIEGRLRNHILPAFGCSPIGSIRPADVRAFVKQLSAEKGLAPATVVATYNTFAKIMRTAEIDGMIPRSPCVGIELPRLGRREEMRFLEPEGVEWLTSEISERYAALIYAAAYTGLRWGELAALRVESVNFLRATIDVWEAQTEISGRLRVKPYTKTGRRRTLSLPPFLKELLAEHLARFPSGCGRVFSSAEGLPLRRNFYRRHFKPALLRTELDPGLRFHDLRHTCAAMLIADGAHPAEIMARLGHASIKTTFDRYGHLFPSLDERLREGLEARYRAAKDTPRPRDRDRDVAQMWHGAASEASR